MAEGVGVITRLLAGGVIAFVSVAYLSGQTPGSAAGTRVRAAAPRAASAQAAPQTPAAKPVAAVVAKAPAADITMPRKVMDQYCVTCHNAKAKTANLLLDEFDLAHIADHPEVGEKVVRKLRAGLMPPTGMPRPDAPDVVRLKHRTLHKTVGRRIQRVAEHIAHHNLTLSCCT